MKRIYLVHGFNVGDRGKNTVGKLIPHLQGKDIRTFNHYYRRFGLLQVLWRNGSVAKKLFTRMKTEVREADTSYAIGHSNGCAIILRALKLGAKFENILLINPALNVDTIFPPNVKNIIVIHTRKDKVVKAARFFDSIPVVEWLIADAWGAMGSKGYTGNDPRVTNIDMTDALGGHSHFFKDKNLGRINIKGLLFYQDV